MSVGSCSGDGQNVHWNNCLESLGLELGKMSVGVTV